MNEESTALPQPLQTRRARPARVLPGTPRAAYQASAAPAEDPLLPLMGGLVREEQQALAALYDATASRVYGVAMRILQDAAAAEEVVSDVYFQAWRQAARYDASRGQVQTWLLVICRSRALDALRRRVDAVAVDDVQDAAAAPVQDIAEAMQHGLMLRQCLEALTPVQRQLLSLAFFKGMTHTEIASAQGMALGSVKSCIRNALLRMRTLLGGAVERE